jgi:hypothetical protein
VIVAGLLKVAVLNDEAPLEKPGTVVEANIVLVGTPELVDRISIVTDGVVPEQLLQNMLRSTLETSPLAPAKKVCASHVVVVTPLPELPAVVFC